MESRMFDNVKFEKENAMARFNRFARLRQFLEVLVVFGVISLSYTARVPAVLQITGGYFVDFSTYLFNHHVVFLIGNAIIVLLFMLCSRNNDVHLSAGDDFYGDYVRYDEAVHLQEPTLPPPSVTENAPGGGGDDEKKQIVVRAEETKAISDSDDVEAVIEKARRQLKKFQRTQSEKVKQGIVVRPKPELRRSETENCRKTESDSWEDVAEIENLSSEEFRRRVDAFIDKHWGRRSTKPNTFENYQQLVKMA